MTFSIFFAILLAVRCQIYLKRSISVETRVGLISSAWLAVPPNGYGGIESVIADLIAGSQNLPVDLRLFTVGETSEKDLLSRRITLGWHFQKGLYSEIGDSPQNIFYEATHAVAARAWLEAQNVELVHDHAGVVSQAIALTAQPAVPTLITLHGPLDLPWVQDFYRLFRGIKNIYFNSISDAQRRALPDIDYIATVYNGIDMAKFPVAAIKKDYCLIIGRITPDKGQHAAIEAAREAGLHLVIAGHVESSDAGRKYWQESIEPEIDISLNEKHNPMRALREILSIRDDRPLVIYFGEADFKQKCELYGLARCTLMPIFWEEPFGLVMVESMACGTPVVGFNRGSVPEVVTDWESGFVVPDTAGMVRAIENVNRISPKNCRRYAEKMFSAERMAENYFRLYRDILRDGNSEK
ncbi:MAG: hypothetical protein A3I38_02725 [Candidatus Wildermuthbacteria bacterium RIFCSPLOWO2_02_FULL_47_10]|nr:MAG: hypothetical protein A3I38_02725 [Candidatus Wildermuthbacteria bacterium RIFCSPLOWO2_02_FULL_47_10]